MKENIGIGPVDTVDEYSTIISNLSYNRVSVRRTSWESACEMPDTNFALILDTNSLVLDEANQASKYITPDQFIENLYKDGDWELN